MKLNDSKKQYLADQIMYYYGNNQSRLITIFTSNQETFGISFYGNLQGEDYNTKIVNLVIELIKTTKLESFINIIKKDYPNFAINFNYSRELLTQILNENFQDNQEILLEAYQLAIPERKISAGKLPANANELISGLTIPTEQTYSYIEKFVAYLLLNIQLELSLKTNLKEWGEKYIKNYEQLDNQVNREMREKKQRKTYLLVAISSKSRSYVAKACKIIDPYKNGKPYSTSQQLTIQKGGKGINEITIKKDLSNFSKELNKFIHQCENLTQIHIFLSYKLMHHPVDCYKFTPEGTNNPDLLETTIGKEYEVIIRCLERLEISNSDNKGLFQEKWYRKGKIFQEKLRTTAADVFILGDANNAEDLFKDVNYDHVEAVKIINVFEEEKYPGVILYQAGIPLALWIRNQQQISNIQEELNALFKPGGNDILLKDLPAQVKIKRQAGTGIGKHLCLLWDDPNLLPPQQMLKPL